MTSLLIQIDVELFRVMLISPIGFTNNEFVATRSNYIHCIGYSLGDSIAVQSSVTWGVRLFKSPVIQDIWLR